MPYTNSQVTDFPETESSVDASPDASSDFIPSSRSVGYGHEDSMNRMPDPNVEWVNEESGEGKGF